MSTATNAADKATEGQKAYLDTLTFIAASAQPAVREGIYQLIAAYTTFGQQHPNPTATINDKASPYIDALQRKANALDGTTINITAQAHIEQARSAFNRLIAAENTINHTNIPLVPAGASGFKNFHGGLALVGEDGPELAILPKGTDLLSSSQTKRALPTFPSPGFATSTSGGSGQSVVINISGAIDPYNTARQLQRLLAQGARSGFSTLAA